MKTFAMFKRIISGLLIAVVIFAGPGVLQATEISITDNGSGSTSEANVSSSNQTSVEQNNQATIDNNVQSNANSGDNTANNNSGETNIQTGEASSNVEVKNQANSSQVNNTCCPDPNASPSSVNISGNGTGSNNTVNASDNSSTNVNVNNNANITNTISATANTGGNTANNNSGNVSISTGNASVKGKVDNSNINNSQVSIPTGQSSGFNVNISGNGAGSVNGANVNNSNTNNVSVVNRANITNVALWLANTGNNNASGNVGNVRIITGNAVIDALLSNVGINSSIVDITCCNAVPSPTPTPSPSATPTPQPSTPPGGGCCSPPGNGGPNSGGGGGGSSSGGGGGGEVLGASLPATGGFSLWQATLFALFLLSAGIIMQLDYGQKKSVLKAKRRRRSKAFLAAVYIESNPQNPWQYFYTSGRSSLALNLSSGSAGLLSA
jgi:hypothetical protein